MGTLHVIATPIGNLEDVTLRALRIQGEADLVFAEDTRRARILLDRHGVRARPVSLHAHNEQSRVERALETLEGGGSVVLISDAGTPLVSDPGGRLVSAAIEAGHQVESVPGPSAVLAALVVSGLPAQPFVFLGFLPRRKGARRSLLDGYRHREETLVLFEAPSRVAATLGELGEILGPRRAAVARELTKRHEEVVRGALPDLAERFAEEARGEFTLVVAGCDPEEAVRAMAIEDLEAEIRQRVAAGGRPREIAAEMAEATGIPKREIYARAVALGKEA